MVAEPQALEPGFGGQQTDPVRHRVLGGEYISKYDLSAYY